MRLWTLHPKYLDRQGLLAHWRESLLAQKVLQGLTNGYRSHPQLQRFRSAADPVGAMGCYLRGIREEAVHRGYSFDHSKIVTETGDVPRITVTDGQLQYEWRHLMKKLSRRAPELYKAHQNVKIPEVHPLFEIVPGPVAEWER